MEGSTASRTKKVADPCHHPHHEDEGGAHITRRALLALLYGRASKFFAQGRGNETYGEDNAERHDDHIIQIPEDRDKIGDEVDRTQRIRGDTGRHDLGVPGHAGIMGSKR